jgi:U3 small nucleolar ribonucleoprotein component
LELRTIKTTGVRRRIFRRRGEAEYIVVEKRMAPTLSRKSTKSAVGVYGEKNERRDCNVDHNSADT